MKKISNTPLKLVAITIMSILITSFIILSEESNQAKPTFAAENNNVLQSSNNDIIPKPRSFQKGNDKFALKKDTSIYVKGNTEQETEEISKIAEFIKEKLKASTGFELNIIKADNAPDGNKKPLYTGIKVGFSSFMTHDEKTYAFIDDVIKEVSQISPSKYIHIGGDEATSTKKADYDYFVGRVSAIVKKYGKTPVGWDPIDTSPQIDSTVVLQNWKDSN